MLPLTKPQKRLGIIAALLGVSQGIAWFVMSLLCIIEYNTGKFLYEYSPESYMEYFNFEVRFLYRYTYFDTKVIITPKAFTVFMWIYLLADVAWVVVSLLQFESINRKKTNVPNLLKCWGILTFLISCIDLLLVIFIATDYEQGCMAYYFTDPMEKLLSELICTNIMIPVMVIAARGFVLWIVNVIFVYIVYRIVRKLKQEMQRDKIYKMDSQIPRPTLLRPSSVLYSQSPNGNNNGQNYGNDPRQGHYDSRSLPNSRSYPNQQQAFRY